MRAFTVSEDKLLECSLLNMKRTVSGQRRMRRSNRTMRLLLPFRDWSRLDRWMKPKREM